MWGIGNINYGLTMRYLGISLGIGIAIGITLIIGTLMTPLIQGRLGELISSTSGRLTLLGVVVALLGVAIVSRAGLLKEKALGVEKKEFNFRKGLFLAIMCGVFSAGMSFAIDVATPMKEHAIELGVDPMYAALPSYSIIMGGGMLVNISFCIFRLVMNPKLSIERDLSIPGVIIVSNTILAAVGGIMWYLQFFFYAWGHTTIPSKYSYVSWMLHMSLYVLCGSFVGLLTKEWKHAGRKPVANLLLGCLVIIIAANIVGLGVDI
jgi:L-rhamnose-H+ transport protein